MTCTTSATLDELYDAHTKYIGLTVLNVLLDHAHHA